MPSVYSIPFNKWVRPASTISNPITVDRQEPFSYNLEIMSIEEESQAGLPRFMVTHEVLGPEGISPKRLDRRFPKPEPKIATVEYLHELGCPEDLIPLVRELSTPWKVQKYIDEHLTYDHSDATRGFVDVARTGKAHCFEGAMFAYTALWLHGWKPKIVLFQADNKYGEDHNIVVYRYNDRLGSVAMSSWQTLKDRPPIFTSLRDLVGFGYWREYTSEIPGYENVYNLVGYTDPIDPVKKFESPDWLFREGPDALLPIFESYAGGEMCTNLFTGKRYPYPDEVINVEPTMTDPEAR